MFAIPVGGQTCGNIETLLAAGNVRNQRRGENRAEHLRDDIGGQLFGRKPAANEQTDRDGRVEMTSADVANGERHGQHRQTKRQGHPQHSNAQGRRRSEHCAAASTQNQPERTQQLSN